MSNHRPASDEPFWIKGSVSKVRNERRVPTYAIASRMFDFPCPLEPTNKAGEEPSNERLNCSTFRKH
ncbi:MAG: hypothetical protein BWY82_00806 [Verrucomicrobia bacterium ADurb.Bin474]|nr:MAG: hypothetical protein BWY82_00806 [Verrucomicrobia bacterium ADurb.Bin474]